jgi:hypothetical protein
VKRSGECGHAAAKSVEVLQPSLRRADDARFLVVHKFAELVI